MISQYLCKQLEDAGYPIYVSNHGEITIYRSPSAQQIFNHCKNLHAIFVELRKIAEEKGIMDHPNLDAALGHLYLAFHDKDNKSKTS